MTDTPPFTVVAVEGPDQATGHPGARGAVPGLREGAARPAVDRDRRPDAAPPAVARRPPHLWRVGRRCCALAARAGDLVPGRPRRRAPRDRAGQPGPGRPALRHADAVGGDPVPHAGRGRPGAPAHPARVPLRRRGRGRVDGRRARPGAHAPRRLPAAGRLELARPPQRDRRRRWRGSTAWTSRSSTTIESAVLRVRPRRDHRRGAGHPRPLAVRAAVGAPRPAPGVAPRADAGHARCSPTAGSTPTRRSPTSSTSSGEGFAGIVEPGHAAVRFTNPTNGGDVLPTIRAEIHRVAPRRARPRRGARSGRRCSRCSTAPAPSPSASTRGPSPAATCSSCRPGSRSPFVSEAGASDSDSGALDLFRFSDAPIFEALNLVQHRPTPSTPRKDHSMKLATVRIVRRAPDRAPSASTATTLVDSAHATSARSSPTPDWRSSAAAAGAAVSLGRRRELRARWCPAGQGRVRRAQLPQPHPRRWAGTCPSTRPCSPSSPTRLDRRDRRHRAARRDRRVRLGGRARRRHRQHPCAAPTTPRRRRRSPASPSSTTSPAATGSSAPGSGCRARTGTPPLRSGPWLVTPDELPGGVRPTLAMHLQVDGERHAVGHHGRPALRPGRARCEYVSTMVRLNPGDIIATGTPGGVGHARKPARYLDGRRERRHRDRRHRPAGEPRRRRHDGRLMARTSS